MAETNRLLAAAEPDRNHHDGRMGFLEHLDELRTRLIRSCVAIGTGSTANQIRLVFAATVIDQARKSRRHPPNAWPRSVR